MGGKPVWCRTAPGPLEPYAVGYAQWLAAQGFSQSRIDRRVDQLGHLSHWLAVEGLGPDELSGEQQLRFSEARRAAGYRTWLSPRSLRVPLAYLRDAGVIAVPAVVVPEGPVERLLDDYRRYLAGERGLVAHTIDNYERVARLFLAEREQLDGLALERLAAQDVSKFLACECPKRSVSGARDLIKGLRALLRYLHIAGVIATPMQWAVPAVAYRRDHNLPLGLSRSDVAYTMWAAPKANALRSGLNGSSGPQAYYAYPAALDREEAAARDLQRLWHVAEPCRIAFADRGDAAHARHASEKQRP